MLHRVAFLLCYTHVFIDGINMSIDLPNKELLEVIKMQTRMEVKLDNFLQNSANMQNKLEVIESDVQELKASRRADKAYIAALTAAFSIFMTFIWPAVRKFFSF